MYNTIKDSLGPITGSVPMTSSENVGFLKSKDPSQPADNWVMASASKPLEESEKASMHPSLLI